MGNHSGGGSGGGGGAATAPVNTDVTPAGVAGMGSLTREERRVVDDYSGFDYGEINRVARGIFAHLDDPAVATAKARVLDAAIKKGTLTREVTLYRGFGSFDPFNGKPPKVGTVMRDRGFLSTSTERSTAQTTFGGVRGTILKITAPRGTRAVDVSHVAGGLEREVLLGRNTRLRVTGVSRENGRTVISATVVR